MSWLRLPWASVEQRPVAGRFRKPAQAFDQRRIEHVAIKLGMNREILQQDDLELILCLLVDCLGRQCGLSLARIQKPQRIGGRMSDLAGDG